MKKMRKIMVVLTPDEEQPDILNVTVPSMPGCLTWGFGRSEALEHAKEAIELYLSVDGEEVAEIDAAEIEVAA